jgi:hypothetical protein
MKIEKEEKTVFKGKDSVVLVNSKTGARFKLTLAISAQTEKELKGLVEEVVNFVEGFLQSGWERRARARRKKSK